MDHKMNYITQRDKTTNDLARYLHVSTFSPATSTFQQSINDWNFIIWPGVDNINFKKMIDIIVSTAQGHTSPRTRVK